MRTMNEKETDRDRDIIAFLRTSWARLSILPWDGCKVEKRYIASHLPLVAIITVELGLGAVEFVLVACISLYGCVAMSNCSGLLPQFLLYPLLQRRRVGSALKKVRMG